MAMMTVGGVASMLRWSALSLTEMFIFLGILILGLAYVWAKGDLDWIKPRPVTPIADTSIPQSAYDKLNAEQSDYKIREFKAETESSAPSATATATTTAATPRPMFKPTFKKPGNE